MPRSKDFIETRGKHFLFYLYFMLIVISKVITEINNNKLSKFSWLIVIMQEEK